MSDSVSLGKGDVIFVSDVHLGGFSPDINASIESRLLSLIDETIEKKCSMMVVGDLFDYWMEYRGRWPDYADVVLKRFEKLNKQSKTVFITGNHDNWTGPRLEQAGFDIEHELRTITLGGKKVMMAHGDGLSSSEFGFPRPLFHRFLRNPYFLKVYQAVFPPATGISLMRSFSRGSRSRDSVEKLQRETKHIDSWAERMLEAGKADVMICGHHHKPVFNRTEFGLYINLGNFCHDSTLAVYTTNGFELVRWQADTRQFLTYKR
ncbi:MAG: UDP-2,3-diacylglucosamine diphosphatase [Balneolia bacterium]|nr:UDP-2,3-diacylglucosamine diphosphatase [Balneolia bacterium]